MAAKDRFGKGGNSARTAQQSEYLQRLMQRLIEDKELRSSLLSAYDATRGAYGRMSNGKPATEALFEDRKLQQELGDAADALFKATSSLRETPKPSSRRGGGIGRALLLLLVGSVAAVALSEGLRTKLLDLLFGAEEEFDYSSTTAFETPAPSAVSSN